MLSVPPYRYHFPAAELVMITLPFEAGRDMTKEAMIQPNAGISAPVTERTAQLASRQVARITRQETIAASGTGPAV